MAFSLLAVYTESLFLACTVAAFYHARRGQWAFAGLAAHLAGLTRLNDFLLTLPFAYEARRQSGASVHGLHSLSPLHAPKRLFGVVAAPLGLLSWMLYFQSTVLDPLAYFHRQSRIPFSHVASPPWNTLLVGVQETFRTDVPLYMRVVSGTDLIGGILLVVATVAAWR